jgi:hypothetical protein
VLWKNSWLPKNVSSSKYDIEGVGIKLALYVYMSGVDPETADSAVEQVGWAETLNFGPFAIFGWAENSNESSRYTRAARQKALASNAATLLSTIEWAPLRLTIRWPGTAYWGKVGEEAAAVEKSGAP